MINLPIATSNKLAAMDFPPTGAPELATEEGFALDAIVVLQSKLFLSYK